VIIQGHNILKNSEPRQTILANFAVQKEFGGAGAIVGARVLLKYRNYNAEITIKTATLS
jgi:hypothetical protein